MAAPKHEEISHPPMDNLQGLEYCIDSNPIWLWGFNITFLVLGTASFLVPLMGGTDDDKVIRVVQTLLFVEGINTLVQTLFGTRLPTVIGGSYAFMVPIISIIHDSSLMSIEDNDERFINTMRAVQGALIVASSIQIILGYSQMWAICSRYFSPHGMVPVIELVGFGLFDRGFPVYLKNFQLKQLQILERFVLLVSITVIWAYAHLLTASGAYKHRPELTELNCRIDKANLISSAPWIKIPYPLKWGTPTFDAGHAFGMMAVVLVSLIESTGAYKAASRLASATPPPRHVLSRGIGWQGIGILLNGLFGTLTGKFGALFASVPFTIFAAVYCVLFGLVASVGLSFMQFTNMNSMRNLFIVGVALFLGLSVPEYFREYTAKALHGPAHTRGGWFNDFLNTVFFSSPTVALIVSVFIDNTLDYKRVEEIEEWQGGLNSGHSKEIPGTKSLTHPFNLNRFFPPP
ncbi:Nucleobase-ascorbate transporter 2 [Hibiscus syriacus]|uniref:Nucleobase-ascorbate transporter 2 n=1 Tax=Hibiscus syriacus TaxID=106335 RepID=A0A6A3A8T9_HIBSY|nr:Nucleobase-ascorbate transporter 2 [Hibiscus syriacus]